MQETNDILNFQKLIIQTLDEVHNKELRPLYACAFNLLIERLEEAAGLVIESNNAELIESFIKLNLIKFVYTGGNRPYLKRIK